MVRLLWLTGLVAALAQASRQLTHESIEYDSAPRIIDNAANSTLAIVPDNLIHDSPYLNAASTLHKRKKIDITVKCHCCRPSRRRRLGRPGQHGYLHFHRLEDQGQIRPELLHSHLRDGFATPT